MKNKDIIKLILTILFSVVMGHLIWKYLRFPVHGGFSYIIGIVVYYIISNPVVTIKYKKLYLFGFLFSIGIILSSHITINGGSGDLSDKNYITQYSYLDIIVLPFFTYLSTKLLLILITKTKTRLIDTFFIDHSLSIKEGKSAWNAFLQLSLWKHTLLFFFCWLPWGLAWYPGFVFWDSVTSVLQAIGVWGLNNHHPIVYTLWVKIWILLGIKIHNTTFGCALYAIVQMLIIGYALSWSVRWLYNHNANKKFCVFSFFYFALNPFIAQTNLAMWKDPLFSITIVVLGLCLYDFVENNASRFKFKFIRILFFSAVICLIRNNGPYVILVVALSSVLFLYLNKNKISRLRILIVSVLFILISVSTIVIEGPVFKKMGWNQSYAETVGIPLNQMARIVTYEGRMSARNKAFMNNLLPLEQVKSVYAPGLVDRYKWAKGFKASYLNDHKNEFFSNYISMIAKNPKIAFEAWELNTIGYWSLNHFTYSSGNLASGNFNSLEQTRKFGHDIKQKNLLENHFIDCRQIFDRFDATFSLGILTWIVILLLFLNYQIKDYKSLISIFPLFAVVVSLLIAAPSFYWERYGYALTLSLPFLIFLFFTSVIKYSDPDE